MLTLNDGRAELWQWDTGRTLSVDADCSQVHFSNKVFGRSIDVDVIDGAAIIPDILLQTDKDLNVWAFVGTSENGYTKISKTFKVNRRNKPADYVFTPHDQTSLEEIKEKIDYLESVQDPDAIKNAVNDYLEKNPVEAPVQSVNGKTGAVELTADDVGAISQDALQEATNEALAQAKASGEFDGADGTPGKDGADGQPGRDGIDGQDGVGIQSVEQTTTSTEDGGTNVVTMTKTDGTSSTFQFKNGSRGKDATVDATLTQSGQAADAAVVGQKIGELSEEIANVGNPTDKPYNMQNIGVLYENPEGYDYVAWCPGNLKYDPRLDKYVSLIYASTQHNNGDTALFVSYIDPKTYEATKPVQCFTDDGATALTGSTAFWIEDDGTYKMLYKYTDNATYLYSSTDGGMNWVQGDKVSGFSGSPWGITKLSNGRLIFGDDSTQVGIYYSDNDGVTWTQVIPTTVGGDYEAEACILELEPGKLIAIARYSMSGIGYNASGDSEPALVSFSEDYGTSWTDWKKSSTITNMNASACTGRVHNGMVDIFACSRWYWHGSYSNTDYDNTGKTGAIAHYTATVENALEDNFTNNGILVYANAVGDTSSMDFHSPALAVNGDEILLMWFDRIPPYTEEKTSHYFARGAVGAMNYAPNDDLVSAVFPYSSAMVEKLLKKQYTELIAKINEIVISGGGTPDIGNDPENPTSYILDGIVLNLRFTDSNTHDTENMTVTDTVNSFVGSLTTEQYGTTLVDTFPGVRNNSIAPSHVTFQADTLSQVMEAPYELSIEMAMYKYTDDTVVNMSSVGYFPFRSNGKGGSSLGIRSDGINPWYLNTGGSGVNTNEMSNRFPIVINVTDGVLAHAVVTFANDGTVSIYKNGELIISEVISSTFAQWAPVTLTRGFAFYGPLKSARIYNRVLTAEEVLNNYNYELQSIV